MAPEGWRSTKLGNVFKSRRERGRTGLPTLSVTLNDGLVLRESLERKTDTNLSPEEHLLVREGDIAYNMMRMWQGASAFPNLMRSSVQHMWSSNQRTTLTLFSHRTFSNLHE